MHCFLFSCIYLYVYIYDFNYREPFCVINIEKINFRFWKKERRKRERRERTDGREIFLRYFQNTQKIVLSCLEKISSNNSYYYYRIFSENFHRVVSRSHLVSFCIALYSGNLWRSLNERVTTCVTIALMSKK